MESSEPLHQIRLGSVDWRKTRDFFGGSLQPGNFFSGPPLRCVPPGPMADAVPGHAMPARFGSWGGLLGLSPMNRCKGQGH